MHKKKRKINNMFKTQLRIGIFNTESVRRMYEIK